MKNTVPSLCLAMTLSAATSLVLATAVGAAERPASAATGVITVSSAYDATTSATASVRRTLRAANAAEYATVRRKATASAASTLIRLRKQGYRFRDLDPCVLDSMTRTRTCAASLYDGSVLVGSLYLEVKGKRTSAGTRWVIISASPALGE